MHLLALKDTIELTCTKRVFMHLKSNNLYFMLGEIIMNCTNENNGRTEVLYSNGTKFFSREVNEFNLKFVEMQKDCKG